MAYTWPLTPPLNILLHWTILTVKELGGNFKCVSHEKCSYFIAGACTMNWSAEILLLSRSPYQFQLLNLNRDTNYLYLLSTNRILKLMYHTFVNEVSEKALLVLLHSNSECWTVWCSQ